MNTFRIGPETTRLQHRAFEIEDAESLYRLNSHPNVMRYTCEPMLQSVREAEDAIQNYPDFETHGFGRWACVLKETKTIIGFCGLKYLSDLDAVDIGYRFFPEYWGQGIATEACTACLQFGFASIGLKEIIGLVVPENTVSIRVLEKSGMQLQTEFDYDGIRALRYTIKST